MRAKHERDDGGCRRLADDGHGLPGRSEDRGATWRRPAVRGRSRSADCRRAGAGAEGLAGRPHHDGPLAGGFARRSGRLAAAGTARDGPGGGRRGHAGVDGPARLGRGRTTTSSLPVVGGPITRLPRPAQRSTRCWGAAAGCGAAGGGAGSRAQRRPATRRAGAPGDRTIGRAGLVHLARPPRLGAYRS